MCIRILVMLTAISFAHVHQVSASIRGAIFTTLIDGTRVNANIYESKDDVYLDGGPGSNAPATAAGLPDGDYYFQVTDPSGKTLLSEDAVKCRKFSVAGGVISSIYPASATKKVKGRMVTVDCTHNTGIDIDQGALTIQLMPYEDTPNPGGVYKVWVTPVEFFVGDENQIDNPKFFHGFVPAFSKTDNYKVVRKGRPVDPSVLIVDVFGDCDLNCQLGSDESYVAGWPVDVTDPNGCVNRLYTPISLLYTAQPGTYTIELVLENETFVTCGALNSVVQSDYPNGVPVIEFTVSTESNETNYVEYGVSAYFEAVVDLFYDYDADGQRSGTDPPVANGEVTISGQDLRGNTIGPFSAVTSAAGCVFDSLPPGDYCIEVLGIVGAPEGDQWCYTTTNSCEVEVRYCVESANPPEVVVDFEVGVVCSGDVAFGTKGYWHNKNGLTEMSQDDIDYANTLLPFLAPSSYFTDGDEPFDGHFNDGAPVAAAFNNDGFQIAGSGTPKAEVSAFLVDSNGGGDPREQLAQQLLAFVFNARNRAASQYAAIELADGTLVPIESVIADGEWIWAEGTPAEQNSYAAFLDSLNNLTSVTVTVAQPEYTIGD